jgi:hypothetical protein
MKQKIAQICFVYGCIASAAALLWYGATLTGLSFFPQNIWIIEIIFAIHATVLVISFYRRPVPRLWEPVLRPTATKSRLAKITLALGSVNFIAAAAYVATLGIHATEREVLLVLSSMILLSTIYIATHWGLRPENLFAEEFLVFMTNPLAYPFRRRRLRRGKRQLMKG